MSSVTIRLFASMREKMGGNDSLQVDLESPTTVSAFLTSLEQTYPIVGEYAESLQVAVNMEMVNRDHEVKPGDEVALLPPVSGG